MIDILVPVLSRPQNAAPLVQNIHDTTEVPFTIRFLCSRGDDIQIDACLATGVPSVSEMTFRAGPGDYSRKINQGFRGTNSEWVFMAADDLRFEPRWDTIALRTAGERYDVVATNDLANAQVKRGQFGTHCLIRRRYITELGGTADQQPGVVLYEGYDHNFVDRELCHVAQSRGKFVAARHSRVKHLHPLWRTAPSDPTYVKALARFQQDRRLFLSRAHLWGHAGLSAEERRMAA